MEDSVNAVKKRTRMSHHACLEGIFLRVRYSDRCKSSSEGDWRNTGAQVK